MNVWLLFLRRLLATSPVKNAKGAQRKKKSRKLSKNYILSDTFLGKRLTEGEVSFKFSPRPWSVNAKENLCLRWFFFRVLIKIREFCSVSSLRSEVIRFSLFFKCSFVRFSYERILILFLWKILEFARWEDMEWWWKFYVSSFLLPLSETYSLK